MLNSKFFITLIGLFIAIFAIYNTSINENFIENFVQHQFKPKLEKIVKVGNNMSSLQNNFPFLERPNYQADMSPRMFGGGYPPYIKYNLPNKENLGVPNNAMELQLMANNNYTKNCPVNSPDQAPSAYNNFKENYEHTDALSNTLNDMNGLNTAKDFKIYNRYIVANLKSRLAGQGDPIRGDLPILPSTQTIFKSSLGPRDLQQGALNVMAGKNSASSALLNLVQQSLGSELSTFAGSMVQSDKMEGTSINDYKIPDISFRSFM